MSVRVPIAALILLAPWSVHAQPADDDGYCDYVEGTAAATAATLYSPELFGQFGYIEQPMFAEVPSNEPNNLRGIAGLRWSVTGLLVSRATTAIAAAECKKHRAQRQLQAQMSRALDATNARALAAKLRVYEDAQPEADRMMKEAQTELDARRMSAPDVYGIRMRAEDLRSQAAQTRQAIAAVPTIDATTATSFAAADAESETAQARLRTLAAYDVSVRGGVDRFFQGTDPRTDYFAVLEVNVNFGALLTKSRNQRAAAGRARYVRAQLEAAAPNAEQVRSLIALATKRNEELTALVADLDRQLAELAGIQTDDSKRFRQSLWFDAVRAKAELAYTQAQLAALRELAGQGA